jgi:hypothetical protein
VSQFFVKTRQVFCPETRGHASYVPAGLHTSFVVSSCTGDNFKKKLHRRVKKTFLENEMGKHLTLQLGLNCHGARGIQIQPRAVN